MKEIDAKTLRDWVTDGAELALLDVREEGVFLTGHLLFAICLPLSHLETRIDALVPRRTARIALCDGGEGLAGRAAGKLASMGYADISILQGGVAAWQKAGYELFEGVNVPSKAFGEFIEHEDDTPRIEATALKRMMEAGEDFVILDSRPWGEYHRMNIPGGIDTPGAELVHRVHDLAPDPARTVVVNCAGRTRSIIGAQSLINAGLPNRVVALKDGTMGWELAGYEVERGATRRAPDPSPESRDVAGARAAAVARRFGIETVDMGTVEAWRESETRTLFVLDVRSPEEFEAGHLPGSRSAPGGQLVQSTDQYVGVRNARLALVDDTGVRATMTASWLKQMGWPEVSVLEDGLDGYLQTGPEAQPDPPGPADGVALVDYDELAGGSKEGGYCVVDFSDSLQYRAGHVPGAWFAVRARLAEDAANLPRSDLYVAVSGDGRAARWAVPELAAATGSKAVAFDGDTAAMIAAFGVEPETGLTNMASRNDDVWYKPYDHDDPDRVEEAMNAYLSWEVELVNQIERDGTANFLRFPAPD